MTRNIALKLSYDGTNYHGWQTQANSPSIQSTLLSAASSLFNEDVKITGCGRTDAGVHAKKYFASVKTTSAIPVERIPYALNSMLPNDISIMGACEVPDSFHPVHSCIKKEYSYYLYTDKARNPFFNNKALHYRFPFNFEAVCSGAKYFVGTHDFAAVRSLGTPVKSTVRTIYSCDVLKENNFIVIRISANGFLYNMARAIVGTLLDVSSGKLFPEDIESVLKSKDRSKAGATAPAYALYMTDVVYPPEFVPDLI